MFGQETSDPLHTTLYITLMIVAVFQSPKDYKVRVKRVLVTLSREKKKNGVITGVISTMELDLEESECFNFF